MVSHTRESYASYEDSRLSVFFMLTYATMNTDCSIVLFQIPFVKSQNQFYDITISIK